MVVLGIENPGEAEGRDNPNDNESYYLCMAGATWQKINARKWVTADIAISNRRMYTCVYYSRTCVYLRVHVYTQKNQSGHCRTKSKGIERKRKEPKGHYLENAFSAGFERNDERGAQLQEPVSTGVEGRAAMRGDEGPRLGLNVKPW